MPVLINFSASIIFGSLFAWLLRDHSLFKRENIGWPMVWLAAFHALVVTPITAYLFQFYPHWSVFYTVNPHLHGWWEDWRGIWAAMAVVANAGAAGGAYVLIRYTILTCQPRWLVWAPTGGAGLLIAVVLMVFARRIFTITDYDTYWTGHGLNWLISVPGWIGIGMYGAWIGGLLYLHRWVKRQAIQGDDDTPNAHLGPVPMGYESTSVTQITRIQ